MNENVKQKILVTGRAQEIIRDVCHHLEADRNYDTFRCEATKTALFDAALTDLPHVIILCLGNETEASVKMYNILDTAVNRRGCTTIVITNEDDEKTFMKYSTFERVLFLSRPINIHVLYEKLAQLDEVRQKQKNAVDEAFREYVNVKADSGIVRKHILIVDDDSEFLAGIKDQLEEFYDLTLVKSGDSALTYLEKQIPDLILLDYLMPGMDGPATYKMMRDIDEYANIPVIFLTGINEKKIVIQTIKELRPQGYIVKPAKKSQLVAKIIDVLG